MADEPIGPLVKVWKGWNRTTPQLVHGLMSARHIVGTFPTESFHTELIHFHVKQQTIGAGTGTERLHRE